MSVSLPKSFSFVAMMTMMMMTMLSGVSNSKCEFEGIFNFGDSNSDTGGFWAAFPAQSAPFGMTYFNKPTGRASDGRLFLDFLAQALGFPFLSPYLQAIGSDYRHGVNYATLASTVLLPNTSLFVTGISPFPLAIQINQMKNFKVKVHKFHSTNPNGWGTHLPSPHIFAKSIYTFYIGQNDFTSNLEAIGLTGVQKYLPRVVAQIAASIKELYGLGGRTFLVLNLAPVGCYPALLEGLSHKSSDIDSFGCLISYNKAVLGYNKMLKQAIIKARLLLPLASLIYVDTHAVMLHLFQHPSSHGLKHGPKACCGEGGGVHNYNPKVYCGNTKIINGRKVRAIACDDPYNYVSWDGIHATEAANKIIALAILNGSFSDPPFSFYKHCHLHPIH
ncbi:GDSL esterase/lipase At4g01130 [Euphorbia lathyris]|uniref:GDSL esterase/lipase At4g01130 n=1 Tax=Euphorbia lathyris TaxID=212925 RepID=UPI003313B0F7